MLRLIVLRHAKSAWDTDAPDDHSRPLSRRGRKAAARVAAELARCEWVPDRVFSSDAARTRETWQRMEQALPNVPVEFSEALYHAGTTAVIALLGDAGRTAAAQTIMLIGHNPGWEEVVEGLTGEDVALTTANAALMECDAPSWTAAMAPPGDAPAFRLARVIRPRELRKSDTEELH